MCFCNAAACQACSKRGNIEERNVSSFLQTTNVYLSTKNTNSLKFTLEQTIPAVVQRSTAFSSQTTATTVITVVWEEIQALLFIHFSVSHYIDQSACSHVSITYIYLIIYLFVCTFVHMSIECLHKCLFVFSSVCSQVN
jgi:hypothetical protein